MKAPPLRLGTRRSALATTQAQLVADTITRATGRAVELIPITSHGDTSEAALTQIGGNGVFVNELRHALLRGVVDAAVHSLKDLPTAPAEDILLAAVPRRADPRDVLVARSAVALEDLPGGARVGTGSPRRTAQLRALRPDLRVVPVRGNVDTRIRLVSEGRLDGVVLARAGLARLGLLSVVSEVLDPVRMVPAPGQGALAVECRAPNSSGDAAVLRSLEPLDDARTRAAVTAERMVLAALEAGCSAPVGAFGRITGDHPGVLWLHAAAFSVDGSASVRGTVSGAPDNAASLGDLLATQLLEGGAATLIGDQHAPPLPD